MQKQVKAQIRREVTEIAIVTIDDEDNSIVKINHIEQEMDSHDEVVERIIEAITEK